MEQLQDAAKQAGSSLFAAAAASKAAGFRALIEGLKAETQGLPLAELVEVVVAKSGLIEHYKTEREGADRIENLAELVHAASTFTEEARQVESGEAVDPLTAFLTHAALEAGEHQAGEGSDALQLMSVHSAKGLEFDVVFLSGLEEGLFPHEQSVTERDGLEEERRLAYVAITRARNRLYLSHAQTRMLHGQTRYNIPSRFLKEIPEELMKWLTPRFSRQKAFTPDFSRSKDAFPMKKQSRDIGGFRIGQNVVHPKFGSGVIIDAEGQGGDARVQVNFGGGGVKGLAGSGPERQAAPRLGRAEFLPAEIDRHRDLLREQHDRNDVGAQQPAVPGTRARRDAGVDLLAFLRVEEVRAMARRLDADEHAVQAERHADEEHLVQGGERRPGGGFGEVRQHQTDDGERHDDGEVRVRAEQVVGLLAIAQ